MIWDKKKKIIVILTAPMSKSIAPSPSRNFVGIVAKAAIGKIFTKYLSKPLYISAGLSDRPWILSIIAKRFHNLGFQNAMQLIMNKRQYIAKTPRRIKRKLIKIVIPDTCEFT